MVMQVWVRLPDGPQVSRIGGGQELVQGSHGKGSCQAQKRGWGWHGQQ